MTVEHKARGRVERSNVPPIDGLIKELDRAICMIAVIDDGSYQRQANSSGSVGAQFRHNIDSVDSFLKGVEIGRIDYGDRERDVRIEKSRAAAIARIRSQKARIRDLPMGALRNGILVRSEIDCDHWLRSSVLRELEFVHSHTVHHHALIAEKLLGYGIRVEKDFGVATSTLQYLEKQAA